MMMRDENSTKRITTQYFQRAVNYQRLPLTNMHKPESMLHGVVPRLVKRWEEESYHLESSALQGQ